MTGQRTADPTQAPLGNPVRSECQFCDVPSGRRNIDHRDTEGTKVQTQSRMAIDDQISHAVIGAAIEVHRALGPGLLESAYEACLCHELQLLRIPFRRQVEVPVSYKGLSIDCAYRLDLLVDNALVVEVKAIEKTLPIHEAQLLTYLRLTSIHRGLILNFHVPVLRDGIKRMVL